MKTYNKEGKTGKPLTAVEGKTGKHLTQVENKTGKPVTPVIKVSKLFTIFK